MWVLESRRILFPYTVLHTTVPLWFPAYPWVHEGAHGAPSPALAPTPITHMAHAYTWATLNLPTYPCVHEGAHSAP